MRRSLASPAGLALVASFFAAGCATAFGRALERGDGHAASGLWDGAAAAYAEAARLEPGDVQAAAKLRAARHEQASERLARAELFAARGELEAALGAAAEAASLEPTRAEATAQLLALGERAVAEGRAALAAGRVREARELAEAVLRRAPGHAAARSLVAEVRAHLAAAALVRADRAEARGLPATALAELAVCLGLDPGNAAARARHGALLARLEAALRFVVVYPGLGSSPAGDAATGALAARVSAERVAAALDPALAIVLVAQAPEGHRPGLVLGGALTTHRIARTRERERLACDYVCGVDSEPNPARADRERDLADAERRLSAVENGVAEEERELTRHETELAAVERDVSRQEEAVSRARADLEQCLSRSGVRDGSRCSSEQSRLDGEQSRLDGERRRLDGPRRAIEQARRDLASARDRRDDARRGRDREREDVYTTPSTRSVDRLCRHGYDAEVHRARAAVALELGLRSLGGQPEDARRTPHAHEVTDVAHRALVGPCAELEVDDPVELPSDLELDTALGDVLVAELARVVAERFEAYRGALFAQARAAEAEGRDDLALENHVRFLLLGQALPAEAAVATAALARATGLGSIGAVLEPRALPAAR